jgi:hypothetical protein
MDGSESSPETRRSIYTWLNSADVEANPTGRSMNMNVVLRMRGADLEDDLKSAS